MIKLIKEKVYSAFASNELKRRGVAALIMLISAVVIHFYMAFKSINTEIKYQEFATTFLLTMGIAGTMAIIYYQFSKNNKFIISYVSIVYFFFLIILTAFGMAHNNAILWVMIFPQMLIAIGGIKFGSLMGSIFITTLYIILNYPEFINFMDVAIYDNSLKIQVLTITIAAYFFSVVMETSRLVAKKQLDIIAYKDPLTGLSNRRSAYKKMSELVSNERDLTMILLDIDHFKSINDKYGHSVGDDAICIVANKIRNVLREEDIACRWGGEEYLVVLPDTNEEDAYFVAERIRKSIESSIMKIEDKDVTMTISAGISSRKNIKDYERLIEEADKYLYQSKLEGRNKTSKK